jgi:hypothetical protein
MIGNMQLPSGANPLVGIQQPMYVPVYQPPALSANAPSPLALPPVETNGAFNVPNSAPSAFPNPSTNTAATQAPTQVSVRPTPTYTLVGILDLGDRSTAMFDMNGSVNSIGLGKAVSNSGWVLSRVSQQEITLKRGKETKTVLVGQKF